MAHPEQEKYALRAIGSPAGVSATAVAVAIGAWQLGILGSFLLGLVAVAVALGAATRPSVRRRLDRTAARRARDRREAARLAVLGASSCWMHRDRYITLREEIEECERRDPAAARRLELEPLLDHFVRIAVRHQRCVDALPAPFGLLTSSTAPVSGRRRELAARRRRCQEDCERHAERLSEEIDSIEELVRLIEQQLVASELQLVGDPAQDDDDELGRRLAKLDELDELDTAMRQVSS